jgi:hypothetical protein
MRFSTETWSLVSDEFLDSAERTTCLKLQHSFFAFPALRLQPKVKTTNQGRLGA